MHLSSIFELWTTLKDGVKSISLSGGQSKTAAAHVARVWGKEQETRYLARLGKRIGPTQNTQSVQHLISILAGNQARRHWVYSGHYPRIFVAPKNVRNAETKRRLGAIPIPLLALSALTTSAYTSLGVLQELNPRPQLLKALVRPLSHISCGATMWYAAGMSDFVVAYRWHHTWTLPRTKVLGKLACLVLSKILRIGTAKCNWKLVKKIKYRDRANLGNEVTAKITNIYGQYQQVKLHNRDDQKSSVGRSWIEEDLHCMKMDVFCADIAVSLDTDARIGNMRTFHSWNEDWQQPSKGVGPRGDAILEEKLKKIFWESS
jgi:hypothetical protein